MVAVALSVLHDHWLKREEVVKGKRKGNIQSMISGKRVIHHFFSMIR